ncbi:MAG: hypothetical protein IPO21_16100 [Bacteroidales bacterium]|nr:hypothetical protein [Bacteroidales bacterium]
MEISSKKLERTSRIVYFVISLLLCLFLILLTNKLIEDIDTLKVQPEWSSFEDNTVSQKINKDIATQNNKLALLTNKRLQIEKTISIAQQNRESEKESFDNWLKTRKIVGSPENDIEVLERARKIDDLLNIEQQWQKELAAIDDSIAIQNNTITVSYQKIDAERSKTDELYYSAMKKYDTSVFFLRLLFVSPILFLGIWFAVKFRKNKYWPLFRGFSFYSLYAFFFGLVPYPS